jgi:hypothetical protein
MKTLASLLTLTSLVFHASCDKDDDVNYTAKETQLMAREWKITEITRKSLNNPNQDSVIQKDCSADDRLAFTSNKQFQFKDGNSRCDTTIFQYDNGSWAFANNETVLKLTGSKRVQNWNIVTFNDSILKVQWLDSIATDNKVLKTISLKNK